MPTFTVHSPSDLAQQAPWHWRDHWVAHELTEAMKSLGADPVIADADVHVWLWGWINRDVDPDADNVLWVIGHPTKLQESLQTSAEQIRKVFSRVFCASKQFCTTLQREHGLPAEWLVCPAPTRPTAKGPVEPTRELAFIGNADVKKRRHLIAQVLQDHDSIVYGGGWWGLLGDKVAGSYYPFPRLHEIWRSARVVPYSHHKDMREHGFISDSVLDAMRCQGPVVISDDRAWSDYGFRSRPAWNDTADLNRYVDWYLRNQEPRFVQVMMDSEVAAQYTYRNAAEHLLDVQ